MLKRIKLGKRYLIFGFQKCYSVKGITSFCKDGKHIVLWDLDGINLKKDNLIHKMKEIQIKFDLSNIYLFRSSPNHYHAYCLKKFDFHEMFNIIRMTPDTDPNFLIWTARRNVSTLRTVPKPKSQKLEFLTCLKGNGKGDGSSAHRSFLTTLIPNTEVYFDHELLTWDSNYDIKVIEYDTSEVLNCQHQERT